jgi:hypothetical protein
MPLLNPVILGSLMERFLDSFVFFNLGSASVMMLLLPLLYHLGNKCKLSEDNRTIPASVSISTLSIQP